MSASSIRNLTIPNCYLHYSKDVFGNTIQALVPFGVEATEVFRTIEDWDSSAPISAGTTILSSSVRALLHRSEPSVTPSNRPEFDLSLDERPITMRTEQGNLEVVE